jgi:hypothetical protein
VGVGKGESSELHISRNYDLGLKDLPLKIIQMELLKESPSQKFHVLRTHLEFL